MTTPYWETHEGWDWGGNCIDCGEAGRCTCVHLRKIKHSRGPWMLAGNGVIRRMRASKPGEQTVVCTMAKHFADGIGFSHEDEANAKLIIAAPGLLEAAEVVIEADDRDKLTLALQCLDTEIKKAKDEKLL